VVGLRAQATAVGFLQLCTELARAELLDDDAVARIKDAIAKDLALSRPHSMSAENFETWVRARLDGLFIIPATREELPVDSARGEGDC
jgi:hypothetical protein